MEHIHSCNLPGILANLLEFSKDYATFIKVEGGFDKNAVSNSVRANIFVVISLNRCIKPEIIVGSLCTCRVMIYIGIKYLKI